MTNKKSYMSFRLVPKSVTLNDLKRRKCVIAVAIAHTLRYFTGFGSFWGALCKKWLKIDLP